MNSYKIEKFGVYNNHEIKKITLTNNSNLELSIINFGAIIQSILLPERFSKREIVLGFETFEEYLSDEYRKNYPYFGAVIGRHSSRIKNGLTRILDKELKLNKNHGGHHLHGGNIGFDSKVWNIVKVTNSKVQLSLLSPDGDEGYPGNLKVIVTYELNDNNDISINYSAVTDQPTIINLTQHSYFNLNQKTDSILNDQIKINAEEYLEFNKEVMPTGEIKKMKDSEYDFTNFKKIPEQIDNSFLVAPDVKPVAILRNEDNSISLEVNTNQKTLHIYSGYYIPEIQVEGRRNTQPNGGVCFETQGFLDAENHDNFPSNVLMPKDEYHHKTIFTLKF